jgi:hypothetical protein
MRELYRFRRGSSTLIVASPRDRVDTKNTKRLDPPIASARLASWIDGDPQGLLHLYERVLHRAVARPPPPGEIGRMRERVREALERGELVVFEREHPRRIVMRDEEQKEAIGPHSEEEKTWIKIQLLDDLDRPAAGKRYKIELPDGTVREGTLDSMGQARETGIDHGNCKISFPDLDAAAWRAE